MKLLLRVQAFERAEILRALEEHNWNITKVAKVLVINRTDFYKKLRKYGIERPPQRPSPNAHRGDWRNVQ